MPGAKSPTTTWDNLNRLTGISYPSGTATVLEYDGGASPTPATKGELTRITDASGSITYSYDAYGEVSGITMNPVNANGVGSMPAAR